MTNKRTFFKKAPSTRFVVKNIAPNNKTVRVFNVPIRNSGTYDLLNIPDISESDIRHSLLKGELLIKFRYRELSVVESDIDLLQFNENHKSFLQSIGITKGLEITGVGSGGSGSGGSDGYFTEDVHKSVRQLIHFIDGGPAEGFATGAFREVLPLGDPFPTSVIWWESAAKTQKIVELVIMRDSEQNPIVEEWYMYDEDGTTVLTTVTDSISYSGPIETTRTRSIT